MTAESFTISYARALLELATEKGEADTVRADVETFLELDRENRRLRIFFENPRIERSDKAQVIEKVFKGRVSDIFFRFLRLVVSKQRTESLRDILEQFIVLHDRLLGRVNVEVTSAVAFDDSLREALKKTLEKRLDKTVALSNVVDEELLGGMVVRFDGMVSDSSLRTAIDEIGSGMLSHKLGSELVHED